MMPRGASERIPSGDGAAVLLPETAELKRRVREHWEAETCGTRYSEAAERSAWLREIAESRYALEPYIREFAQFDEARGKSVLEIGTGAGVDFAEWCRHAGHATGIDLTEAGVALTRERLSNEGIPPGAYTLKVADAEMLPFGEGSFDIVYSWGVLHHTPSTERAFAEAYRVLKPGGTMRAMVYHVPSWTGLMLYANNGLAKGRPWLGLKNAIYHHLESPGTKSYSRREGLRLLTTVGFSDVAVSTRLGPGDLLLIKPSEKYRGTMFKVAASLYPRNLVRLIGDRMGLYLLLQGRKPR